MVGFTQAIGAIGDVVQGAAASEAGRYTKRVSQINAVNTERDGAAQVMRVRDAARLQIGRQLAGLAGSGFTMDGSAFDAVRESLIERELDAMTLRRRATSEANAKRAEGSLAAAQGHNAMMAGLISGAAKVYDAATTNYAAAG